MKNDLGERRYFSEGRLNYQICGRGQPLLFLHGYGLSPWSFQPIIKTLAQKFLVIAPYLSSGWQKNTSNQLCDLDELNEILIKLLERLKIEKPLVVGYSMGGWMATRFALKYPEKLKNLIIINGAAIPKGKNILQLALDVYFDAAKNFFSPKGFKKILIVYLDYSKNILIHPYALLKEITGVLKINPIESLSGFKGRVLILWGKKDLVLPYENALILKKSIENSVLETIEEGDHDWGFLYPDLLLDKITQFINSG